MTINIALVTSDALVLGCDSISSETDWLLNPWDYLDKDANGQVATDADGKMVARFDASMIQQVVTNAFAGVTKMVSLSHGSVEAAATTSGLAKIGGQTISSIAGEFLRTETPAQTMAQVVEEFKDFIRAKYVAPFPDGIPFDLYPELEFLVGGYDATSEFPSLYRIRIKENTTSAVYQGGGSGLAWAGQADSVERLIFGYDSQLAARVKSAANKAMNDFYEASNNNTIRIIEELMAALGIHELPQNVNTELVAQPVLNLPFDSAQLDIDFANLPIQDAVEFVSYLVNLQSGRAKFSRGVATVGGRTHVGVIRRNGQLDMLNESPLIHRNLGYSND